MPRSNNQSSHDQDDDNGDFSADRKKRSQRELSHKAMRRKSRTRITNDPKLGMSARRQRRWSW